VSKDKPGQVIVLRGFANGDWECSMAGGASSALVRKVEAAAEFATRQSGKGRWEAEWRIPLMAMGIKPPQPANEPKLRLNLTCFKACSREWTMWLPTHGNSYRIENAGIIQLVLPGGG